MPPNWRLKSKKPRAYAPGLHATGSPNGTRTRVSTLRGWCPGPLDDGALINLAAGLGFEPRQRDPESRVLPLHHPAANLRNYYFSILVLPLQGSNVIYSPVKALYTLVFTQNGDNIEKTRAHRST